MRREAACAGRFYPGDEASLRQMVRETLHEGNQRAAFGAVAPHAGYIYSGGVAGETISALDISPTVLVLCPKHTRYGGPTAIWEAGEWALPGGVVEVDAAFAAHLMAHLPGLVHDPEAHVVEHAVEVLLPFLRERRADVRFVPIALAHRDWASCRAFGESLAVALEAWPAPVLVLSSSDMNHFEDQQTTLHKDQLAIDKMLALDPEGLYQVCRQEHISMCGVVPTVIAMIAGQKLGQITSCELIQHTTSAAVSGDEARVVGYAGLVFR